MEIESRKSADLYKEGYRVVAWYVSDEVPSFNIMCWKGRTMIVTYWKGGDYSISHEFENASEANEKVLELLKEHHYKKMDDDYINERLELVGCFK